MDESSSAEARSRDRGPGDSVEAGKNLVVGLQIPVRHRPERGPRLLQHAGVRLRETEPLAEPPIGRTGPHGLEAVPIRTGLPSQSDQGEYLPELCDFSCVLRGEAKYPEKIEKHITQEYVDKELVKLTKTTCDKKEIYLLTNEEWDEYQKLKKRSSYRTC